MVESIGLHKLVFELCRVTVRETVGGEREQRYETKGHRVRDQLCHAVLDVLDVLPGARVGDDGVLYGQLGLEVSSLELLYALAGPDVKSHGPALGLHVLEIVLDKALHLRDVHPRRSSLRCGQLRDGNIKKKNYTLFSPIFLPFFFFIDIYFILTVKTIKQKNEKKNMVNGNSPPPPVPTLLECVNL